MSLKTFFEKFDLFVEAPDAVPRMRELILESAIRGRLVSQSDCDEPASELLKRMASVQPLQVRKQVTLPPVDDDAYLRIPKGWAWTRLGNTGRIFNGDSVSESGKAELAKVEDGLPFIATKDVGYGRGSLVYENGLKVPRGDPRFKMARANAVLICAEGGSAGRKIGITDRDICFGNKLYANEVREGVHHRYIFYVYQAPTFFREFATRMTGIIGGIARSEFLSLPIPLPPKEEQIRIVAKLDELMTLCDRLEAERQERQTQHSALARAALARFTYAPTPANLRFLFHPSYEVLPSDLRKSILTLAVQGKLVPQDPNDEPADGLLSRIQERRSELQSVSRIPKPESQVSKDDACTETLPHSWKRVRIGDLCLSIVPQRDKPLSFTGDIPWVTLPLFKENSLSLEFGPDCEGLSQEEVKRYRLRLVPAGSVLMSCIGRFGLVAILDRDVVPNQQIHGFYFPTELLEGRFLCYSIMAQKAFLEAQATTTTIAYLNKTKCESVPIALPPLAEQRRIVAKLDQLMTLVDALEAQLAASRVTAANLLEAAVAEFTIAA